MTSASTFTDAARVAALRGYDILDTPRERDFDDIVDLAAAVCETPVAVITLIDATRQWFKAEIGLNTDEIPLDTSICAQVMTDDAAVVEINDTHLDARTRANPLCLAKDGLRFYGGALLRSGDGHVIGTLCVLDYRPRRLTDVQRRTLAVLAAQVMAQIELRAALRRQTLMRRETDHRVKNSLASVASFVRLRQRGITDPAAREDLRAVGQQIETVELLHNEFCEADTVDTVEIGGYLRRVTALLAATVPASIGVVGDYAEACVDTPVATATGTIVNELVANAIKHGYDLTGTGRIMLTGTIDDDGYYHLVCQDDAPCAPATPVAVEREGRREVQREGLGLRIIAALVKQVGGTLTRGPSPQGYRTAIVFPVATSPAADSPAVQCSVAKRAAGN